MLGNDIVDLHDLDSRPETFRPRFDARVFDECEQRAIAHDLHPLARRWAHWGAKEAAYKLVRQVDPGFVFAPRRLVVRFEPISPSAGRRRERRGRIDLPEYGEVAGGVVEVRSFETPEYVHVIALPEGADWGAVAARVSELDPANADPSEAVRRLARAEIACSLGVEEARLAIGRRGRIPTIELDHAPTSLSLSLSHQGRWIAYAMMPEQAMTTEQVMTPGQAMTPGQEPDRARGGARSGWTPGPEPETAKGTGATIWQTT
jgi:hypothetical protein